MFAPIPVTITNINIEGGINMFGLTILAIATIIIAAIVAAFVVLSLTDYDLARSIVDAIPVDVDALEATIAHIPGDVKRWAKSVKNAAKEAWHTTVNITHDIVEAIKAIAKLFTTVFDGICDDIADFIGRGNVIVDAIFNRLPKTIVDIDGTTTYKFPFSNNNSDHNKMQRIHCVWNTATFYVWRFCVGIKDAINLALDFVYAAIQYAKAHTPDLITDIQVNTWNAITGAINAIVRAVKGIISAAKTIARFVRETIGIFAAIGKLIGWVSGGVGLDANNALAKVANKL